MIVKMIRNPTMTAEVLEESETEYELDESHANLYVSLKDLTSGQQANGAYRYSPLETEPPAFEAGQTVELWGDFDPDEGCIEISSWRILKGSDTEETG